MGLAKVIIDPRERIGRTQESVLPASCELVGTGYLPAGGYFQL